MQISKQLIALRTNKRISQEELGNELGISRQAISKWETDQGYPETENLIKLVQYYNTSADYILFGKNSDHPKSTILEKNFIQALIFFGTIFGIISITVVIALWLK